MQGNCPIRKVTTYTGDTDAKGKKIVSRQIKFQPIELFSTAPDVPGFQKAWIDLQARLRKMLDARNDAGEFIHTDTDVMKVGQNTAYSAVESKLRVAKSDIEKAADMLATLSDADAVALLEARVGKKPAVRKSA